MSSAAIPSSVGFPIPRREIRPAIRDLPSVNHLNMLMNAVVDGAGRVPASDSDKRWVKECASEIYWRTEAEQQK